MSQQSDTTARTALAATQTASTILHQTLSDHSQRGSLGWAKRIAGIALTGLSLSLLANGKAEAVSFTFEKVVDTNTPIPGGTGTFDDFSAPSLDSESVAFWGSGSEENYQRGIYTNIGGKLNLVADTNTPIPGGTGTFDDFFYGFSLDNGNVAFAGGEIVRDYDPDFPEPAIYKYGIYTNIGGVLAEVIAEGDLLDGKETNFVFSGPESLSGNQIAFTAEFEDGSAGIYVATVPEPSSVLGTLAFGAFGAGWMLKRRQKKQKVASHAQYVE